LVISSILIHIALTVSPGGRIGAGFAAESWRMASYVTAAMRMLRTASRLLLRSERVISLIGNDMIIKGEQETSNLVTPWFYRRGQGDSNIRPTD